MAPVYPHLQVAIGVPDVHMAATLWGQQIKQLVQGHGARAQEFEHTPTQQMLSDASRFIPGNA